MHKRFSRYKGYKSTDSNGSTGSHPHSAGTGNASHTSSSGGHSTGARAHTPSPGGYAKSPGGYAKPTGGYPKSSGGYSQGSGGYSKSSGGGYSHAPSSHSSYGSGGNSYGGHSSRNRNFRRPMQKSRRMQGSTINVKLLINKVSDDAFLKPAEHVLQHQFDDFKIDPRIKNNIKLKGYISPTPIQDQAIPVGLEGKDVIGLANTGTGKTAAFLVPLLNKMLENRQQKAIILAPTRELALQINDELKEFGKGFGLNSVLCIGGSNIMFQIRMLKHPFNFIIGTPGRILDLLDRKLLFLDRFQNVVLDEADRMVDMGFINDIRTILAKLPPVRQSFFFTATLESKVEDLIRQFTHAPVKISVKMRDTAANIEQDIVHVPKDNKARLDILIDLLKQPKFDRVLVFGRTKHGVEKIAKALLFAGVKSDSIHGNKSQNYRQKALMRFKKGEVKVLVATDVAARGLDINDVSHVINFDIPANYEDYIHRIGRTGRADKKGIALTFVSSGEGV